MRLIPPSGPRQSDAGGHPRPKAQQATIEKQWARYLKLECGHAITSDDDLVYDAWRPDKRKSFCENCGTWKSRIKPSSTPYREYPNEPLF